MDTKKIRALLTALDTGSLTAAAEELGYTQSGLTHMMNSLEDELGVKLLVRSKGGVRLSPAGRELLPQMNALMQCADELQRSVDRLIQRRFTVLRLGAYSSVARQWLPAILSELRRTAPEIDVSITTGGMREKVTPEFRYTGLDDAAIVSMAAHGLGVSMLSELVMDGISDKVLAIPLSPPAFRRLGLAVSEHLQNDRSIKSFVQCAQTTMRNMYGEEK